MKFIIGILLVLSLNSYGQVTLIPDSTFENSLILLGKDNIIDGQVLTNNIDTLKYLFLHGVGISDLTGIEDFTALETLFIGDNMLTAIDVSQNINLRHLRVHENQLTTIDISSNPFLNTLMCWSNQIYEIDLSNNPLMTTLYCDSNDLNCLNLKNDSNQNYTLIHATNNSNLLCVQVDNPTYSTSTWSGSSFIFDPVSTFNLNCTTPCALGVKENLELKYSLFPNPSTGFFSASEPLTEPAVIAIFNYLGKQVQTLYFETNKRIEFNLEGTPGIYLVQVNSGEHNIVKKVIKK